jgi:hypothetical protein
MVTPHAEAEPAAPGDRQPHHHPGYEISQRIRRRIEEAFGWPAPIAGLRKTRHRGLPKFDRRFTLAVGADDLVGPVELLAAAVP